MIKVFGVGNILLGDYGIGVRVLENLKERIESLGDDVDIIIGPTDMLYCVNKIKDNDEVIIVDSTCFMTRPGLVIVKSLSECDEFINYDYSLYKESLVSILRKENRDVKGYFIGIEISNVDYSEGLSKLLKKKFKDICDRVYNEIEEVIA